MIQDLNKREPFRSQIETTVRLVKNNIELKKQFAMVWRFNSPVTWFEPSDKPTSQSFLISKSFSGQEGSGIWKNWPSSVSLSQVSYATPPEQALSECEFSLGAFEDEEKKSEFCSRVKNAVNDIRERKIDKVVLSRRRVAPIHSGNAGDALLKLLPPVERETIFLWHCPNQGTYISKTPETLFEVNSGKVSIDALAGTADNLVSLLAEEKNFSEQSFVIKDIKKQVYKALNNLSVTPPKAVSARNLFHLYSSIIGDLKSEVKATDLIGLLHPTAAVGIFPREFLKNFDEYESLDRGYYAAPFFCQVDEDNSFAVVAIRSALIKGSSIYVFGGAGIVADSDPDSEWHETKIKMEGLENLWSDNLNFG